MGTRSAFGLKVAHGGGEFVFFGCKVRPDGSVKVLDFGLAKAGEAQEVTPDSPTMMPGTQMGMILGTAGYMSPEQARGKEVDKRADIWAFGVVLYEMVTGKRLFEGETVSDSLAAVLKSEPGLDAGSREDAAAAASCLEKDPKIRLRDIRLEAGTELRVEITLVGADEVAAGVKTIGKRIAGRRASFRRP